MWMSADEAPLLLWSCLGCCMAVAAGRRSRRRGDRGGAAVAAGRLAQQSRRVQHRSWAYETPRVARVARIARMRLVPCATCEELQGESLCE